VKFSFSALIVTEFILGFDFSTNDLKHHKILFGVKEVILGSY
jgi:hypothetical protein